MLIFTYVLVYAEHRGTSLRLVVGLTAEEAQLGTPAKRTALLTDRIRKTYSEARITKTQQIPQLTPALLNLTPLL